MIDRWSRVNDFYRRRREQVFDATRLMKKYRSSLLPLENELKRAERNLEGCKYEGINLEDGNKKLENVKVQYSLGGSSLTHCYFHNY